MTGIVRYPSFFIPTILKSAGLNLDEVHFAKGEIPLSIVEVEFLRSTPVESHHEKINHCSNNTYTLF